MIQSVLFFILGFLSAGLLALMIAPAAWRRAASLTRRRIEATVPLTQSEIQAGKDSLRAEFAMSARRLEMNVDTLKEKTAQQLVEINRAREEMKTLAADHAGKIKALTETEAKGEELRTTLGERDEQIKGLKDRLAEAGQKLETKAQATEKLEQLYEEASFSSSNRQIELVAREAEIEKLAAEVKRLREQRKDADRRHQEFVAENRTAGDALKAEKRRNAELDKKLERLLSNLADRDEKIERREKDLVRLREQMKASSNAETELVATQARNVRLEGEHAELSLQLSKVMSNSRSSKIEEAIAKLDADRERLETQMKGLESENMRLKADVAAFKAASPAERGGEHRQSAVLREQMSNLAAEVVNMTAMLDGQNSPIDKALASSPDKPVVPGIVSLADRVRALRKAASAG